MPRADLDDIDLGFRPKSYFWPMGLETHLLARIKGAERKAALKHLIDFGRHDDIPDLLAQSALSPDERRALGSSHPAFMGGEYLPDLLANEVMIARITIASTTQDVVCVYARRTKHRIHYRVVDEYEGETLSEPRTRTSVKPLTLGELEDFLSGAWSLLEVIQVNYENDGLRLDEVDEFVICVDSEFYPEFGALYRCRIAAWVAEHAADDDDDDDDPDGTLDNADAQL
jgi:hypothetical protein